MTNIAEVKLWGRTIGAVSLGENDTVAVFQYAGAFTQSNIQVSPMMMPLSEQLYSFPALGKTTFHGLPGLLADSLPDKFGNALIDAWLATQGRKPESFNAIERLCYIGKRGMGALEFEPSLGPKARHTNKVQVDKLVELASQVLTHKNNLSTSIADPEQADVLKDILKVGTSAGGARAKAIIAWNPLSNEVRSGQIKAGLGFQYWLLKFDGVTGNKDKELEDPKGYGAIEYAYANMARDAGINISECHLLEENGRRHFMTRRFDRLDNGEKLHMQSLGAMAHFDYNMAGAYSYEQALMVIRELDLGMDAIEEQFRRMVFNIMARNQDDHVKNIAFLMDKSGNWSLSPAFDLTYSYNPAGKWTAAHQMSMNGKTDHFSLDDFRACAKTVSMKRGRAEQIIKQVEKVICNWHGYAVAAGVSSQWREQIQKTLRLNCF